MILSKVQVAERPLFGGQVINSVYDMFSLYFDLLKFKLFPSLV